MGSNPIDLTTVALVASWLSTNQSNPPSSLQNDPNLQACITAWSAMVLRRTGRGPQNTSFPTESPFVDPVTYSEIYDGNGTNRLQLRNWPIVSVSSLQVYNWPVPASTGYGTPGYSIDGDGKSIVIIGGYGPVGSIGFYQLPWLGWGAPGPNICWQPTFGSGAPLDVQNVSVTYTAGFTGTPPDLELMATQVAALNYKRRNWIDEMSLALANGAGTTRYRDWEIPPECERVIREYMRK